MNFLNNTFVTLQTAVGSSDGVIFAKNFVGNLGDEFPIFAVIAENDDTGKVIKREIIKITGKNNKMLNVERAVESCPQSDDAENPTQNPLNFSDNAIIYHTLTAGNLKTLFRKFDEKLNKNWGLRTGFGANKTVVVDANWNEIIKNRITTAIEDTDSVVLRTNNMDERVVRISEFKQSMTDWTKKYTAWENITGVAPIPVMIAENVRAEIDLMPKKTKNNSSGVFHYNNWNFPLYDAWTINISGGNILSNTHFEFQNLIIDLWKIRKIKKLKITVETASTSQIKIYRSNTNSDFVEIKSFAKYVENEFSEICEINNNLKFLKISCSSKIILKDLQILEEKNLNWVYASNSDFNIFNRVDGFVFANSVNSSARVGVVLSDLYANISGFEKLNNKEIFLGGKWIFTTEKNANFLWIVKNNKLFFMTKNIAKIEKEILNLEYKKRINQIWNFYSEIASINAWKYKINANILSRANFSFGNIFVEFSVDGKNFTKIFIKNFGSDLQILEEIFDLNSGFVRIGIEFLKNTDNNFYVFINNFKLSKIW